MSDYESGKIVLEITENEDSQLDDKSEVKSIEGKGLLKVINPSGENRLWNLKLSVDKADFTNLKKEESKEALESKQTWEFPYEISNLKDPILKFTEIIDTSKNEGGINHNFVLKAKDDESSITLILANVSSKPIQNIILKKNIPGYLKELKVEKSTAGDPQLDLDSKELVWKISSLAESSECQLIIVGKPIMDDSTIKSGNSVDITYESVENSRSNIIPSIDALTNTMSGVDKEEDDDKPGGWNCEVEIDNESDFELTLKDVEVTSKITTGVENLVSLTPSEIILPNKSWTHKFSLDSPSVPTLTPTLGFTANFIVPQIIIGKIGKQAQTFEVLETEITKNINPPTVNANSNTEMTITNTIINKGTSNIDCMDIVDVIPKDFEPPGLEQLVLTIVNGAGTTVATLNVDNAKQSIAPDNKESTSAHTIKVECSELDAVLRPNCKLIMAYPIIARNPQPNVVYETPVEIISHTKPRGPGYKDKCAEIPVVGIQYVKRKIKTMKSVSPGSEGAFNVVIKINNKGGVELENITIIELIPAGFTAGDFKPEDMKPEYKEEGGAAKIIWKIARINPNESIKLKYVSEGKGEFSRSEPEVIIAEPDSLKKDNSGEPVVGGGVSVQDQGLKSKLAGIATDILDALMLKINEIVKSGAASKLIEDARDELISKGKSSTVLHEFMESSKELAKDPDKTIVGSGLDDLISKIKSWKSRLIA
jgi:hypothetical protein